MMPKKNDFETGKFYRRWIQRNYLFGYVVWPLITLLNGFNLVRALTGHSLFGAIFGVLFAGAGLAMSIHGIIKTPRDIRDVRRRWMEMDVLTHNNRAMQSRIDVHLGRKN